MALTPDGYKELLMQATQSSIGRQLRQDLEVRIAALLKLRTTGIGFAIMENMAREASKMIVDAIQYEVVDNKTIERAIDKLL